MGKVYIKVSVEDELPTEKGKYVVFTKTMYTGGNVLKINYHLDQRKRPQWGCNNQLVTHWLKLIEKK